MTDTLADLERLERPYAMSEDGPAVTGTLVALCRSVPLGGRQVYDVNIVATMLTHGETCLLTFNVSDFARFRRCIQIVSP